MKRWTLRFLVFSAFSVAQILVWFYTMDQTDFPTGEVQYAIMPALLHPYLWPWQAPYSIFWYIMQYALIGSTYPFVFLYQVIVNQPCPDNCMAIVQYLNGTQTRIPFDGGLNQWIMGLSWMTSLAIWNIPFIWLFRRSQMLVAYWMGSLWLWATVPVNVSVLWITVLGYKKWIFLPLAIIIKFPFFAPASVWNFAIGSGSTPGHWFPYLLLGVWVSAIAIHLIDKHRHQGRALWVPWLALNSRMARELEPEDRYLARWLEYHWKGPRWKFEEL